MSSVPAEVQEIKYLLQLLFDKNWPAHRGVEVRVRCADGHKDVLHIPPYAPPPPRRFVPDDDDGLTEMERDAVQAVAENDGEPLTADQIAEKAGYDCNTRFKETLSRLVRAGRLDRAPGRGGYVPPSTN